MQRQPREEAANMCAHSLTHQVRWSSETESDAITARAEGPSCKQAIVTLEIRNAEGDPLWVFATTHYDMTAGGIPAEGAPAVSAAQMEAFLEGWSRVSEARSGALPAWADGASAPATGENGLTYTTPFDRETYEALRQRNLRELCYAAAVAATQCLVIDPGSNAPTQIVAFGP